jgi:hypothetical protein
MIEAKEIWVVQLRDGDDWVDKETYTDEDDAFDNEEYWRIDAGREARVVHRWK